MRRARINGLRLSPGSREPLFSIGVVTVAFVGHLGEVELAAVSIVQNVLEGFVYGIMENIAELAGKYALWVIPQLFAYAVNFPLQKFLQAQSKIWVMTTISVVVLGFHVLLNWILIVKFEQGLGGAAIAENISWWLVVLAQIVYIVSGYFPYSWTGFSLSAFKSLLSFVKLSFASAIMLCLELWYYTIVILIVGWLKNP